jgi:hypothetical protein
LPREKGSTLYSQCRQLVLAATIPVSIISLCATVTCWNANVLKMHVHLYNYITMTSEESQQLMCNICGMPVSASEAKQHASMTSHELHKVRLEHELLDVREEYYQNDTSVIAAWQRYTLGDSTS